MAEVCPQNLMWDPRPKLEGEAISRNYSIREFQKGDAYYLAEALEKPFLLLKDMAALRNMRQPDLFLFLKRDLALDLRVELKKAQEAAKVAKERESFELGVQETEIRLMEELAEVCRDYCQEVWTKALNLAGVPTTLEWRKAENVYFPQDIHETLAALPPSATLAPTSYE